MRTRPVVAVAVVALAVVLAACGQEQQPLHFGTLQLSGSKIDVSIPPNGVADPKDWPRACSLLDDTEVESVLPGADVSLTDKDVKVIDPKYGDRIIPHGQCEVTALQPGVSRNYPDMIFVDIYGWGAPKTIEGRLDVSQGSANPDFHSSLGPQHCAQVGGPGMPLTATLRCTQGPLYFQLRGAVGDKTEIAGASSKGNGVALWYENVVKPLARAVGSHVPS